MLFEIESIITRKIRGNKKYYLIKWKGYPISDCTWEPLSHLSNIRDMVQNFDKNYPLSIDKKALNKFKVLYRKYKLEKRKKNLIKHDTPLNNPSYDNKIVINIESLFFDDNEEGTKEEFEKINKVIENKKEVDTFCKKFQKENDINEKINDEFTTSIKGTQNEEKNKLIEPVLIW